VQQENGLVEERAVRFNPPANKNDLDDFFNLNNWSVPDDYYQFLLTNNGAYLFEKPNYGGGLDILSIGNIPIVINEYGYMFPKYCYSIGYHNSAIIFIDSEMSKETSEYLFWQSCDDSFDQKLSLGMNFETWFELFVVAQGSEFWLWPHLNRNK